MTLERLIADGRIHPARIEETVEKCRRELELSMKREGERAVMEVGIHGIHPDIVKLLGRLKFRTSFGQNVLNHSLEVSYLSGLLAGEMGVNVTQARRAGLLHDIGSFEGVENAFAVQAGREVRIMVKPDAISDDQLILLARSITKKIEEELDYPGQIKVNVIRESRAVEYAK